MKLVFVTNDFAVDPAEVSSLEAYDHWANSDDPSGASYLDHSGVIVIQKCGRKAYLRGLTVRQVADKLKPAAEETRDG